VIILSLADLRANDHGQDRFHLVLVMNALALVLEDGLAIIYGLRPNTHQVTGRNMPINVDWVCRCGHHLNLHEDAPIDHCDPCLVDGCCCRDAEEWYSTIIYKTSGKVAKLMGVSRRLFLASWGDSIW